MSNYFRITVYHPVHNISAIIDSNEKFEKLWQFSAYLVAKGFKIINAESDQRKLIKDRCDIINQNKVILIKCDISNK